jgi:FtsP/CotA-like multicopper oxidase with cupredoxin domain
MEADLPVRSAWTRRQVLIAGAGGVAVVGLAACGGSAKQSASPRGGALFTQPNELVSKEGRLEVTLRAEAGTVPSGDGRRFAYTYNGGTPGPTLRVRPGDRLVITLENRLDEPTNLHTHGLHVSPLGDSDNVFVQVDPGQSHTYTYEIPTDHRSSLCWYHPHHHGMVAPQLGGGLFGGIIIEDELDQITEIAGSTERLLILNDPRIGQTNAVVQVSGMEAMQGREGDAALVNGLSAPNIAANAGTLERWRILNASPSRYYRLALDGLPFQVIAADGGRLARPDKVDEILLAPGERTEVLVTPTNAGSHALRTLGYDRGSTGMGGGMMGGGGSTSSIDSQIIATMVVTGSAAAASVPARLAGDATIDAGAAGSERPIALAMGMGANGGGMGGGMGNGMGNGGGMMSFTINGESFDPNRTNISAQLNTTEDWVLNNTSGMDHPFHLHAWPFRVIERSSGPVDVAGWKDTVNVPAGGSVRIRIPFTDIVGRTVYHCHILDHEDQGMMGVIEVR